MENQVTRSLTTKKVIEDFKAKKEINLSKGDAENILTLFISSQNKLNSIMLAKLAIQ